jgi:hypothetical protein
LALESTDLPAGGDVADIVISGAPRERDGRVWVRARALDLGGAGWPYASTEARAAREIGEVALVPYHDWANRGPSTMRVWLPAAVG